MKKVIVVLTVCLLLSGCNEKKLECEKKDNYWESIDVVENYELTFDGKEITDISYDKDMKVTGDLINDMEILRRSYASDYEMIDSSDLVVESNVDNDKIEIEVDANYNKLSDEEKKVFSEITDKSSLEETKKLLESKGYKCK